MGCDIHLFIEYKENTSNNWWCFGSEINPGRNYSIFAHLCGVRNYHNIKPITEPRGLPDDVSFDVLSANTYCMSDHKDCGDDFIYKPEAIKLILKGYAKPYGNDRIVRPDWHSHSWATAKELNQVLKEINCNAEWEVVLAILKKFEELGKDTRIVFWFDN